MTLRILAGEARGRQIKSPPRSSGSRPILARIKKSLFDILTRRLVGARFLDLFAGTGSVGLEALSRGALRVTFVEKNTPFCRLIEENLATLGYTDRAEVLCGDALRVIETLSPPFDVIFMGPPYKTAHTGLVLEALACPGLLKPGGWIIGQHHIKEVFQVPRAFSVIREGRYGDTKLTFLECDPR